jgi:hypothetical protein
VLRQGTAVAALAVASVALAACGGSDSNSGKAATAPDTGGAAAAPAPSPSARPRSGSPAKAAYIRRADQVCTAARSRLVPLRGKILAASRGSDPNVVFQRYARLTGQAANVYSDIFGQLRSLSAPAGDQAQIDRMNGLVALIADIERQISSAAVAHDSARIKALNLSVTRVTDTYRSAARAYGLRECGAAGTA